jgi:hypothetical protein
MVDNEYLDWIHSSDKSTCPFCGAYYRRSCEMEDEADFCAWEDATEEPDPDRLREDRDEKRRLDKENSDGQVHD